MRTCSLFVATLLVRLVTIAYLVRTRSQSLLWGINEAGVIARSIVLNHSYSSPFHDAIGPTAWIGPVYPTLLAMLFKIFGVQSSASLLAAMILNAVFASITAILIYRMARNLWSERAGLFAGLLWAFCPYLIVLVAIPWETCLAALMFTVAFGCTLGMKADDSMDWVKCGVAWGLLALINPSLVTPLPFLLGYRMLREKQWRPALMVSATVLLIISPWMLRNYEAFHRFVPIRSNGMAEIYFANVNYSEHPLGDSMEYQKLGEARFTSNLQAKALDYFSLHPGSVIRSSFKRAAIFWANPLPFWPIIALIHGAALVGLVLLFLRDGRAWMFAAVLAIFPLVYYASLPFSRYRHPIEPLLCILAGCALASARDAVGIVDR